MSGKHLPRLSAAPVIAELERQHRTHRDTIENCGVALAGFRQWLRRDLSWRQADEAAAALGLHPNDLWGDEWWAIEDAAMAQKERRRERARMAYHAQKNLLDCRPTDPQAPTPILPV